MTLAAVMIPGSLCDERVFKPLEAALHTYRQDSIVATLGDSRRVEEAAVVTLASAPRRFIALGFSLGGFVALEMLRIAPHRVAGVILAAGNAHPDSPENATRRRADVARSREIGMRAFVDESAEAWGLNRGSPIHQSVADMAEAMGTEAHDRHAEMNIERPDLRDVASNSPVPIYVLAGRQDRVCPAERYVAAASGPNGRLRTVSGAGHYLPLECPEAIVSALREMREHE